MTEIREFDLFTSEILSDPYPYYQTLVADSKIIKIPHENTYVVFSGSLIREMLSRVDDFSSNFGALMEGRCHDDPEIQAIRSKGCPFVDTLLTADPPRHTSFRRLVNLAFSKPRVAAIEPRIRAVACSLIDEFAANGKCDLVSEFAIPLPVAMISEQLGLSHIQRTTIKAWTEAISDRLGGLGNRDREIECAKALVEFQLVMLDLIADRRRSSKDDLLSHLVNARIEDDRALSDVELLSVLQQLMAAGNITTTSTISGGMLLLIQNPVQMALARSDRSRLPTFIEEMLRFVSPAQGITRMTKREVKLGEFVIPSGSLVMARIGAANRDPAEFVEPNLFDGARKGANRHFSFGYGIHVCIGNMLARTELVIAFEELLNRLDDIAIDEREEIYYPPNMRGRSLRSLRITFKDKQPVRSM